MHHRVHLVWTQNNRNIGLSWNLLKEISGAGLHAVHVGDRVPAVHIVHYIEVAHLISRGPTGDKNRNVPCDT